jgi:hypothetical protein
VVVDDARFECRSNDAGNKGRDLVASLPFRVVRSLLKMNEMESLQLGPDSEFVTVRLMELILLEILRSDTLRVGQENSGLLAGLANPVTACALSAMHRNVTNDWTVSVLARLCGVSRSTLAVRFRDIVGMGPIEYLQHWRET